MKKIISYIAITAMLFACSKESSVISDLETDPGSDLEKAGITVTTNSATIVTSATATSGGNVQTGGGGGNIIEKGVCYNTNPNPKIIHFKVPSGSGNGNFISILTGLDGSTTYYARAYAIKKDGTVKYGNQVTFTTLVDYGTVTDIDGNVYNTITIGNQVWMLENLKTTKYRNGISIPNITDDSEWANTPSGAYCDYDNNPANSDVYGRLYNNDAASDSLIAPTGWHVAHGIDFNTLMNYLVKESAGGHLKEVGYTHWSAPNTAADNSSGFTALPAGRRYSNGVFQGLGLYSYFWTSSTMYQMYYLRYDNASYGYANGFCEPCLHYGLPVRCVKN